MAPILVPRHQILIANQNKSGVFKLQPAFDMGKCDPNTKRWEKADEGPQVSLCVRVCCVIVFVCTSFCAFVTVGTCTCTVCTCVFFLLLFSFALLFPYYLIFCMTGMQVSSPSQ